MNEQTLQKMRQLKFYGMARAFQSSIENQATEEMTTDEFISFLVESEWDERNSMRIERTIKKARFRYKASMEQLNFDMERNLDKNQIWRMAECSFIRKAENIIIIGSTGIGKSYIASALGNHACTIGFRVLYVNTSKLFARLKMAKADGSYLKEIARIEKQDLLIMDDFGIQPLDSVSRSSLMEIIEDRHGRRSTIVTSQVPVNRWHEVIGEQTIADAVLDRIVHNAHKLDLKGESLRKRQTGKN